MKNKKYTYEHEKLGKLVVEISSGDGLEQAKKVVPPSFLVAHKNDEPMQFLFALYGLYAGKNDALTNIIGELCEKPNIKETNEQLAQIITSRYANLMKRKNAKLNAPIVAGDGINISIIRESSPNDPLYTATITVKKSSEGLCAFIESQSTDERYQRQGLMSKVINTYLPEYCTSNDIKTIALEVGEIGGVNKDKLSEMYQNLGFEKGKNGVYTKPVTNESSMTFYN